jgi:catechol 2,3-dioxygenase-like lactoylglutathione lyase family enzyme
MEVQAIDHVALTVPDLEEATEFFTRAFGARIVLDGLDPEGPGWGGEEVETRFGTPTGAVIRARRLMSLAGGVNLELFCFEGIEQRRAARTVDFGLQHIALRVEDLQQAAKAVLEAGGRLYAESGYEQAVLAGRAPRQGWLYCEAPWGTVIELVTFKEA